MKVKTKNVFSQREPTPSLLLELSILDDQIAVFENDEDIEIDEVTTYQGHGWRWGSGG